MYKFASVSIEPFNDLKTTADVIGEIFGGIKFKFDDEWDYDEFPAYIAKDDDYEYALLGIPDPKDEIRDDPPNIFQFEVSSIETDSDEDDEDHKDISEEIVARLNKDGRLICSV